MYQIELDKAKSQIELLIQTALDGEEVVITREMATQRIKIPALPLRVEYDPDVDTLYLRFKEGVSPTHSKDDPDKGVVYDYRGRSLIGIEILDASQG